MNKHTRKYVLDEQGESRTTRSIAEESFSSEVFRWRDTVSSSMAREYTGNTGPFGPIFQVLIGLSDLLRFAFLQVHNDPFDEAIQNLDAAVTTIYANVSPQIDTILRKPIFDTPFDVFHHRASSQLKDAMRKALVKFHITIQLDSLIKVEDFIAVEERDATIQKEYKILAKFVVEHVQPRFLGSVERFYFVSYLFQAIMVSHINLLTPRLPRL